MNDRQYCGNADVLMSYLYDEGDNCWFMDQASYDQFPLKRADIEYELGFIRANDEVRALVFNGTCIGIDLPLTVTLEITETQPGFRGDTVNNALKPATLETGIEVQVPLFCSRGEKVVVDTRDARYVRRA
jgi:elongation factor P